MNEPDLARLLKNLPKYSGLVFQFSLGIIAGFFVGQYFDLKWGTDPLLMITGVFIGLVSGLYLLYREAIKDMKKK